MVGPQVPLGAPLVGESAWHIPQRSTHLVVAGMPTCPLRRTPSFDGAVESGRPAHAGSFIKPPSSTACRQFHIPPTLRYLVSHESTDGCRTKPPTHPLQPQCKGRAPALGPTNQPHDSPPRLQVAQPHRRAKTTRKTPPSRPIEVLALGASDRPSARRLTGGNFFRAPPPCSDRILPIYPIATLTVPLQTPFSLFRTWVLGPEADAQR